MNAMLDRVKKFGITMVMVTHEQTLAACGNRIVTLSDGKIISNEIINRQAEEVI